METPDSHSFGRAELLWKSIARQPEYRDGLLKLNGDLSIRTFKNQPQKYLESDRFEFVLELKGLLKPLSALNAEKLEYLIFRIFETYQNELLYEKGEHSKFSIDIVFQLIEFFYSNGPKADIAKILQKETSLEKKDVDSILSHIKVFNKLGTFIAKSPNLKKTIESSDSILTEVAALHMEITWLALESMFFLLVAQQALSQKYSCESLLKGWRVEYGFDEIQYARMMQYFPPNSSLMDFRGKYVFAIQSLHSTSKVEKEEFDLLLLRSIANYFSSWIAKVAKQMEVGFQT